MLQDTSSNTFLKPDKTNLTRIVGTSKTPTLLTNANWILNVQNERQNKCILSKLLPKTDLI
jgi:hypothetical protein